jgi:hypothetical protein
MKMWRVVETVPFPAMIRNRLGLPSCLPISLLASSTEQKTSMAQHYRITLLPGDGIGPEIMAVAGR